MRDFYPQNRGQNTNSDSKVAKSILNLWMIAILAIFLSPVALEAQVVYTVVEGTVNTSQQGPNPFATSVRNQRTQYLYVGEYLLGQNAPNGYITAIALKINAVSVPSSVKPENLQIKMGLTNDIVLPATLVPNLPVHYSSAAENINSVGWHTFNLDTPFEWNGYGNIIIEICRTNVSLGSNFFVEATVLEENEYRTVVLSSNTEGLNGCTLEGSTPLTLPNRRTLPSMRFTMTNPCAGTPIPGTVAVSGANNCTQPFTLSVVNSSQESGLVYQWQSTHDLAIPFQDIVGAVESTLTVSQQFATYYRRSTACPSDNTIIGYTPDFLVSGPDCLCAPTVTNTNNAGISSVNFGDINNSSTTNDFYTNFLAIEASVAKGSNVPLSVNVTTVDGTLTTKAWFDWNKNQIFEDEEGFDLGTVASGVNVSSGIVGNIMIPDSAELGATIMRIRTAKLAAGEVLTPCGNFDSGETEDYSIVLTPNLGVNNPSIISNSIVAFSNSGTISARSTAEPIESIKIYDLRGRLLLSKSGINSNQTSIQLSTVASQLLLVEIKTASGLSTIKKVTLK